VTALRPTALAAAVLAAVALTGCGASLDAQTYQERNQAESTDTAVGALAVRNVAVMPPRRGETYEAGDDAEGSLTVTNRSNEADTLVEISSPDAEQVVVLEDGQPGELEVPALGSTTDTYSLRIEGLREDLRTGEYIRMSLRFENNGSVDVLVPVMLTGETDRPIYTGEEGGEGEPALQGPAGGHGEDH
jgi:copper(I)-binding protein